MLIRVLDQFGRVHLVETNLVSVVEDISDPEDGPDYSPPLYRICTMGDRSIGSIRLELAELRSCLLEGTDIISQPRPPRPAQQPRRPTFQTTAQYTISNLDGLLGRSVIADEPGDVHASEGENSSVEENQN